ncbi:MAG: hypothetical protein ACREUN_03070 [Burkholderiales bacterium]
MAPRFWTCSLPSALLLAFAACTAQAEVRVSVVETDPPGEAVTLGRDETFWVRLAYTSDEPVQIWARPYLGGKEVVLPGTFSNPSIWHSGSGQALGWFSFRQAAQADEVRIQVGRPRSPQALDLARYPVRLSATGQPAAARTPAAWVAELRSETQAKARLEQERISSQPASPIDTVLTYGLMLLISAVVFAVPALLVWAIWRWRKGGFATAPGEPVAYAVSVLAGAAVCLAISAATGRKEAWDSGVYFSVGIPVMVLTIFTLSYVFPWHAWRWTLSMALGQSLAMLLGGNSLSLWPLAILAMLFFSLPQFAAGLAASWLARRSKSGSEPE